MATSMNDFLVDETSSDNKSGTRSLVENDVLEEVSKTEDVAKEFSVKTWKEDLTLSVEGKQLYVSSALLALSSPVLSSKLEEVFNAEDPKILELPGRYDDFVEFLRCTYPSIKEPVTEKNALKVLLFAHEYEVESIKKACEDVLIGIVAGASVETLSSILKSASSCQMAKLRQACIHEIIETSGSTLESAMSEVQLSPDDMLEIRQAQATSVKNYINRLTKILEEKIDRCNEFENLIKSVWLKGLEIVNWQGVELHVLKLSVCNDEHDAEETIKVRNIIWTVTAKIEKKGYRSSTTVCVNVSATGDQSWKQWTCKFKVSCRASDGKRARRSEESANIGSSNGQISVDMTFDNYPSYISKNWKVTVVFAVGDVVV